MGNQSCPSMPFSRAPIPFNPFAVRPLPAESAGVPTTFRLISTQKLRSLIADDPEIALLDVRTPDEFEEAHIPGARSVPLGGLDPASLLANETLSRSRPVFLVCKTENRSRIAAEKFVAAGHLRTFVVSGGTLSWIEASLPVVRGPLGGARPARERRPSRSNSPESPKPPLLARAS